MDTLTGEELIENSDVCIYEWSYLHQFPIIFKKIKNLIVVGTPHPDVELIRKSRVFFTKMDWIHYFVAKILPEIKAPFELVTHESDHTSGGVQRILEHPHLVQWRGCNMSPHPKTLGLPLSFEGAKWGRTDRAHLQKCAALPKTKLLYFNFNVQSNPGARRACERALLAQGHQKNQNRLWKEYIEDLAQHKYCASPEGNGVDCHRTWEALALGVIPIVVKNPIMYTWFKDLPILWVDSYENLFLEK